MTKKHVLKLLESWGWQIRRDEVGDYFAKLQLSDREVSVAPNWRRLIGEYKFSLLPSVMTEEFSYISDNIHDSRVGARLVTMWNALKIQKVNITDDDIKSLADQALDWARAQSLQDALEKHAALPTDAKGVRPVYHLSSLVILGDIETLEYYKSCFEQGDRLGFVPYITKDYIDRAYALALKRSESSS